MPNFYQKKCDEMKNVIYFPLKNEKKMVSLHRKMQIIY